jgi:hypothetical protein
VFCNIWQERKADQNSLTQTFKSLSGQKKILLKWCLQKVLQGGHRSRIKEELQVPGLLIINPEWRVTYGYEGHASIGIALMDRRIAAVTSVLQRMNGRHAPESQWGAFMILSVCWT